MDPALLNKLQSTEIKLGEKHKLLNSFLREAKQNPSLAEKILQMKDATDFYIKKLRFDVILALQRVDLLIELFNSEEKALTERVSKKGRLSWIFTKEGSPFLDPEFLVKEFFPKLSYVCRLKFVNQLAKYVVDESKCEKIFELIQATFGLKYAARLLPNCSPPFISKILATNRLKQVHAFLLPMIAKKHPQVGFEFLKQAWERANKQAEYLNSTYTSFSHEYGVILRKLASLDLKQFLDLYEQYYESLDGLHIGPVSRHIVKNHLDRVLASPVVYASLVCTKYVLELDKDTIVKFLVPLMPKRFSDLNKSYYDQQVKHIHPYLGEELTKRGIFAQLIEKAYPGQDVVRNNDNAETITENIASYFGPEDRLYIAEQQLQDASVTGCECYNWISMKPTSKSIPELKQLLFIESDAKEREHIIAALLKTCKINNDKTAFLEVMKFLVQRYRNDQIDILVTIINGVEQFPNLLKLGTEHWDVIQDLLQVCLLHPMADRIGIWRLRSIIDKIFIHRAERNLPLEAIIEKICEETYINTGDLNDHGPAVQRKFIEACSSYYSKKYATSTDVDADGQARILQIAEMFKAWNKQYRKVKLSLDQFPVLKKKFVELASYDETKVQLHSRRQILDIWINDPVLHKDAATIYQSLLKSSPTEEVLMYFLHRDPASILTNIDTAYKSMMERYSGKFDKFLDILKFQGYGGISTLLVEKCLARLEETDITTDELSRIFSILGRYQSSAWVMEFLKKYVPEEPKIDLQKVDVLQEVQRVQYGIRLLLQIDQPSAGLDIIKLFCVGDYLKYGRDVLYSLCEHTNVSKSLNFISAMLDSPVSFKKHAIRILFNLTPNPSKKLTFLEDLWKKEENVSIREVLLNFSIELFLYESTASEMARVQNFLFNTIIPSLTFKDKAALQNLVANVSKFISLSSGEARDKLLVSMFEKLLMNQENLPPIERLPDNMKTTLIGAVGENHSEISDQLMLQLCQKYFLSSIDVGVDHPFLEYAVKMLVVRDEKSAAVLLPVLLNKLSDALALPVSLSPNVESESKKKKDRNIELRSNFGDFIPLLCRQSFERRSMERKKNKTATVSVSSNKYIKLLEKIYKSDLLTKNLPTTFDQVFWIRMSIIFNSNEEKYVEIGREVLKILNEYIEKYGNDVLLLFVRSFEHFVGTVPNYDSDSEKTLHMIQGLINFPSHSSTANANLISTPARILALELFPAECPDDFDNKMYIQIDKLLFTPGSDVDSIYINHFHWKNAHIHY